MPLVFFYPQFKKLTGAERLILKLSDYASRDPSFSGEVVLLTHRLAAECRPALGARVRLVESGLPQQVTGNHYVDAAVEYAAGPALAAMLPRLRPDAVVFFGPPSVPAMWFSRRVLFPALGIKVPLLYFCFEPPRFIYRDTEDIVRRLGPLGAIARPLFRLYRALDRRMVRSANRVLSNSPFGSRKIREAYSRPSTVIPHGVDFPAPSCEQVEALLGDAGHRAVVALPVVRGPARFVRTVAAELSDLATVIRTAPAQALARAHLLAARGEVPEEDLGRISGGPAAGERMRALGDLLVGRRQAGR